MGGLGLGLGGVGRGIGGLTFISGCTQILLGTFWLASCGCFFAVLNSREPSGAVSKRGPPLLLVPKLPSSQYISLLVSC